MISLMRRLEVKFKFVQISDLDTNLKLHSFIYVRCFLPMLYIKYIQNCVFKVIILYVFQNILAEHESFTV